MDVKKNETQVSGLGSSGAGQGHMAALLHRALNSTSCKISGISWLAAEILAFPYEIFFMERDIV